MTNTLFADNEISPNLRKILSRHDGKTKHGKTLYLNKQNISFKANRYEYVITVSYGIGCHGHQTLGTRLHKKFDLNHVLFFHDVCYS